MAKRLIETLEMAQILFTGAQVEFDEERDALIIRFKHVVLVASETYSGNWMAGYVLACEFDKFVTEFDDVSRERKLGFLAYSWGRPGNHDWSNYELLQGARYGAELNRKIASKISECF